MTKKKQVGVRFDSNRTRLKTGETQRPNGTYAYRWSTPDGKRHSIYAPTLEKLREQEEQIIVDKHDGIRSDVKSIRAALKALTPEERDIIMNFYFSENPLSGEALAEKFATTKSSIYRRRDHALRKLKSILDNA